MALESAHSRAVYLSAVELDVNQIIVLARIAVINSLAVVELYWTCESTANVRISRNRCRLTKLSCQTDIA